jgi:hypothetical protein
VRTFSSGFSDLIDPEERLTAEAPRAQSKFLIKQYSNLCELCGREKKSPPALRLGSGQPGKYLNYQLYYPVRAEALEA